MKLKNLGEFYGISLTNSDIKDYRIELTTKKTHLAKKFLRLLKQITGTVKDTVIYLEDIEYGLANSEISKIKAIIPNLEEYEYYVFQKPTNNSPRIVIKNYNKDVCEKINLFLNHLNLLLENQDFCQGFYNMLIESQDNEISETNVRTNYFSSHIKKVLQTLNKNYVLTKEGFTIKNNNGLKLSALST